MISSVAQMESTWNPNETTHPDGKSYGLLGINFSGGIHRDYNKKNGADLKPQQIKDSIRLQVLLSSWYLGKEIPRMLEYYKIPENLLTIIGSYNAGIGRVKKFNANPITNPLPDRTLVYHTKVQSQIFKRKINQILAYMSIFVVLFLPVIGIKLSTNPISFKKLKRKFS